MTKNGKCGEWPINEALCVCIKALNSLPQKEEKLSYDKIVIIFIIQILAYNSVSQVEFQGSISSIFLGISQAFSGGYVTFACQLEVEPGHYITVGMFRWTRFQCKCAATKSKTSRKYAVVLKKQTKAGFDGENVLRCTLKLHIKVVASNVDRSRACISFKLKRTSVTRNKPWQRASKSKRQEERTSFEWQLLAI